METQIQKKSILFLFICLCLGALAEWSFLHGKVGLSYIVFITGFYFVLFLRYRLAFNHRRIGLLFMVAIWILAASYLFYDNIFYNLNLFIIPIFVLIHIVLITSPNQLEWAAPSFAKHLWKKLAAAVEYSSTFFKGMFEKLFKQNNVQVTQTVKRILLGLVIGIPLLLVITGLLMSADTVFQDLILRLPEFLLRINFLETTFRLIVVIGLTFLFFGVFQVLEVRGKPVETFTRKVKSDIAWDSITALTIMIMLNSIYLLFVFVQFRYFFSDGLQTGFTFAEYARRGFFELLLVTMINWTILISFLKFVKTPGIRLQSALKIMYSLLIAMSGIMLVSAYQRLSMYEAAYGFTIDRILAHACMIFLMVIFTYTFIRVWIERLSLMHFYFIAGLIFYTGLNAINIENIIVESNLERYEETGKVDINYLNSLSYTGMNGLLALYEKEPDYPGLRNMLHKKQQILINQPVESWQSFNFTRQDIAQKLKELDL